MPTVVSAAQTPQSVFVNVRVVVFLSYLPDDKTTGTT